MHNRDVIFQFGKWSSCTDLVVLQVANASGCPVMQPDVLAPLRDSTAEINNMTDLQQMKIFLALKLFNVRKSRRKLRSQ